MATGPHDAADGRKYIIVGKGDTLSEISEKYFGGASKYKQLAAINDISDPDYIVIGQTIYLSEASSSSSTTTNNNTIVPIITRLGFQANLDNTILMTFKPIKHSSYPEHRVKYWVDWDYYTEDGMWFEGVRNKTTSDTDSKEAAFVNRHYATYSFPSNAIKVRVRIYVAWFRDNYDIYLKYGYQHLWTTEWETYDLSNRKPNVPGKPTLKLDGYTLTTRLDNIATDPPVDTIEFRIYRNDTWWVSPEGMAAVKTDTASYAFTVAAGNRYKAQCRAHNIYGVSGWSGYTDNVEAPPVAPKDITVCKAASETAVYLEWTAVDNAAKYEIQYAENKDYLDNTNLSNTTTTEDSTNHYTLGNLTTGMEYFFRVRTLNNSNGKSEWSGIKSVKIGTKPAAPTTWSSTNTVLCGEVVTFYWTHNSEDGSDQTLGQLELTYNGTALTRDIYTETEFDLETSSILEGATIYWRVRTAGVTGEFGPWSVTRKFVIVAPAVLELSITDVEDNPIETLTSLPLRVKGHAGPNTQISIGYHVSILSNQIYETVDYYGNIKTVNKDEQVYSKYFNGPDDLAVDISAGDVSLENGVSYTLRCVVAMDSGLTAESHAVFTVGWSQSLVIPNPDAEIIFDSNSYVTHIRPYCDRVSYTRHKVDRNGSRYIVSSNVIGSVYGNVLRGVKTTTGEQVYYGTTGTGEEVYYCEVFNTEVSEDVVLSVYRREFDGSFTEIIRDIKNGENTYVTDPHPSLDYARYRIVATHTKTTAVSYYDIPGYPINCHYMIIQWGEAWSQFNFDGDAVSSQPPWSGSMLKLKANLDVSDQYNPDTSLANYIGRKHPVAYYGTHKGHTSSWNTVIPKDDKETLYALRRLAEWMGNVYVREPSGSGYWANIKVSFNQKHKDLTIPISFSITRVEGGI